MSTFPGEVFADTTDFDPGIRLLIPHYEGMLAAIAQCLSPDTQHILELGSGTGELSRTVLDHCPQARLVAMDYSPRMVAFAQAKLTELGVGDRITWVTADFGDWAQGNLQLPQPTFDACVSSLAIHHLSDVLKLKLFGHIHHHLRAGGSFWNADPVLADAAAIAEMYQRAHDTWTASQGTPHTQIQTKRGTGDRHGHSSQDQLATLTQHLQFLHQAGFESVDVPWKYYGLAVFGGFK